MLPSELAQSIESSKTFGPCDGSWMATMTEPWPTLNMPNSTRDQLSAFCKGLPFRRSSSRSVRNSASERSLWSIATAFTVCRGFTWRPSAPMALSALTWEPRLLVQMAAAIRCLLRTALAIRTCVG